MELLVLGLVVFLGTHSLRLRDTGLRNGLITRFGEKGFKGLYSVLSLAGFWFGAGCSSAVVDATCCLAPPGIFVDGPFFGFIGCSLRTQQWYSGKIAPSHGFIGQGVGIGASLGQWDLGTCGPFWLFSGLECLAF